MSRESRWFGFFAFAWGGFFAINNGMPLFHPSEVWRDAYLLPAQIAFQVASLAAIVALALIFPRPLGGRERLLAGSSVTVAAGLVAISLTAAFREATLATPLHAATRVLSDLVNATLYGYLLLLVLRLRAAPEETLRRQLALTAAAVTLYVGYNATFGFYFGGSHGLLHASGWTFARSAANSAVLLAVAGLTLFMPSMGRLGRHLAWLTLASMLVGLLMASGDRPVPGGHGVVRTLLALVLAYAITKHRLLGIDVKLRFALSRSTIAAVFIAAFFIASEAAQQFFGDTLGSTYVGIAAAGMLVFAMAPLQRVAERLAERAVPSVAAASPAHAPAEKEEMYREAVRLALRDRAVSRAEERHLFRLARGLGLTPDRAHEILVEVEAEPAGPS